MPENCKDCSQQSEYITYNVPRDCDKLPIKDCKPVDSSCVYYTSSPLSTIGVTQQNPTVEHIIQKIDEFLAGATGSDYLSFNTRCITASTEKEFVEGISLLACQTREELTNLTSRVITLESLPDRINLIENPNLTLCSYIGTTTTSTLNEILVAISNKVCELHGFTSIDDVTWSLAYSVLSTPSNIEDGFNEVFRQIALLKSSIPTTFSLPTINTSTSCLPTTSTTTPLVTVVNELVSKVCTFSPFDFDGLVFGCVTAPAIGTLNTTIQNILNEVGLLKNSRPIFNSEHFHTESLGCDGTSVSIKSELLEETFKVKTLDLASEPKYLADIIEAGEGVSIDVEQNKLTVSTEETGKVKVSSSTTKEYLKDTIEGDDSTSISIEVTETGGKLKISSSVDLVTLTDQILTTISTNPTLLAKFCNLVCQCENCN